MAKEASGGGIYPNFNTPVDSNKPLRLRDHTASSGLSGGIASGQLDYLLLSLEIEKRDPSERQDNTDDDAAIAHPWGIVANHCGRGYLQKQTNTPRFSITINIFRNLVWSGLDWTGYYSRNPITP